MSATDLARIAVCAACLHATLSTAKPTEDGAIDPAVILDPARAVRLLRS